MDQWVSEAGASWDHGDLSGHPFWFCLSLPQKLSHPLIQSHGASPVSQILFPSSPAQGHLIPDLGSRGVSPATAHLNELLLAHRTKQQGKGGLVNSICKWLTLASPLFIISCTGCSALLLSHYRGQLQGL